MEQLYVATRLKIPPKCEISTQVCSGAKHSSCDIGGSPVTRMTCGDRVFWWTVLSLALRGAAAADDSIPRTIYDRISNPCFYVIFIIDDILELGDLASGLTTLIRRASGQRVCIQAAKKMTLRSLPSM
eukprot:4465851-Amphidinium_carterae.1